MIQGQINLNPFEKHMFLKKVKNQPIEMSIQPTFLHLVDFEKNLKNLTLFDFVVKSIQPVDS